MDKRTEAALAPFISVVVPVYNAAPWLPAALESLQAQTFTDFEVLLVDDGSTDDSAAICAEWCEREPRFSLIRQANAGPSEARLTGIRAAKGEYLAFMDSDDLLAPGHLEQLAAAARQGHDLCSCGWQRFSGEPPRVELPNAPALRVVSAPGHLDALLHDKALGWGLWNKLYRRSLVQAVQWPVGVRHNEDLWANWRLFRGAQSLCICPAPTYLYRLNEASASSRPPTPRDLRDHMTVADAIRADAAGGPAEESAFAFHFEKMLFLYSMILRRADQTPYAEVKAELAERIRGDFARGMRSPRLAPAMKAAALLTRFGGPAYGLMCRTLLK